MKPERAFAAGAAALLLLAATHALAGQGPIATARPDAAPSSRDPAPAPFPSPLSPPAPEPAPADQPRVAAQGAPAAPAPPEQALHAPAGVADCVWAAVPEDVRQAVASARSMEAVVGAVRRLASTREQRIALARQCGAPADAPDPAGIVRQSVQARVLQVWTAVQLTSAYHVDPARLAEAWRDASAEDRARLASWCAEGFNSPDAPLAAVRALSARLGLAGGDAASLLGYYAGARALLEQLGAVL